MQKGPPDAFLRRFLLPLLGLCLAVVGYRIFRFARQVPYRASVELPTNYRGPVTILSSRNGAPVRWWQTDVAVKVDQRGIGALSDAKALQVPFSHGTLRPIQFINADGTILPEDPENKTPEIVAIRQLDFPYGTTLRFFVGTVKDESTERSKQLAQGQLAPEGLPRYVTGRVEEPATDSTRSGDN